MTDLNHNPGKQKKHEVLTVYGYEAPPQPLVVYGFDIDKPYKFQYSEGTWAREVEEGIWEHKNRKGGPKLFHGRDVWEVVGKLEEAFGLSATNRDACQHAEITENQFYDFLKGKELLAQRFKMLQESKQVIKALKSVDEAIEKDPKLALQLLEKKRRKEWGNSSTLDVNLNQTKTTINAQLIAIKAEFEKKLIDGINHADLNGEIPPASDDYQIPPPKEIIDQLLTKGV